MLRQKGHWLPLFFIVEAMKKKVLIACECSQVVTEAFREEGHEAWSCDIVPCYGGHPEWHIQDDARKVVAWGWDLIIAHPPCTMLTHVSAVAYSKGLHTDADIAAARDFFLAMLNAPCAQVAVENPAPMRRACLPPYNQIVQPYDFGHPYSKRICLWLRGLPPLLPMGGYYVQYRQWNKHCAGNARRRSHFWTGIAEAMAKQWGAY